MDAALFLCSDGNPGVISRRLGLPVLADPEIRLCYS